MMSYRYLRVTGTTAGPSFDADAREKRTLNSRGPEPENGSGS